MTTGGRYAARSEVPADHSRTEIERTLTRYGASSFLYGWQGQQAAVSFDLHGRRIRFLLPLPAPDAFHRSPTGRTRTSSAAKGAYEQAVRQRWRALALIIKAKLEAIESGVATLDDEFLAYLVLPGGGRVGEQLAPDLAQIRAGAPLPPLLPAPGHRETGR